MENLMQAIARASSDAAPTVFCAFSLTKKCELQK